jgi:hypothetical protein
MQSSVDMDFTGARDEEALTVCYSFILMGPLQYEVSAVL